MSQPHDVFAVALQEEYVTPPGSSSFHKSKPSRSTTPVSPQTPFVQQKARPSWLTTPPSPQSPFGRHKDKLAWLTTPGSLPPSPNGRVRRTSKFAALRWLLLLSCLFSTVGHILRRHVPSLARQHLRTGKPHVSQSGPLDVCSAIAFDAGRWALRADRPHRLHSLEDVHAAMNVSTCKALFQPTWNLGISSGDPGPYNDRIGPMSYEWIPHSACQLHQASALEKMQALVDGPLLLIGDSRTRQHFFQLSCELADHVVWQGDPPASDDNGDLKAWRFAAQHLLVDESSPLFQHLKLPKDFDLDQPLVSFLMTYVPLSREELKALPGVEVSHIQAEAFVPYPAYERSMNESLDMFAQGYKTMVFSTGAHFGETLPLFPGSSVPEIVAFERASVRVYFKELKKRMRPDQRIFVRAAGAAHSNCGNFTAPLDEVGLQGPWHNYQYMSDLNDVLRDETVLSGDARFVWLGMDRMARLRPDSHLPGDCLHYAVGAGVVENWSRYIFHNLIGRSALT